MLPDADRALVRLVVGTEDAPHLAGGADRSIVAVTVTHVRTLESVQLKGPASLAGPATPQDLAAVDAYCDAFFGVIAEIDGIARELMERLLPPAYSALLVDVEQVYNQTPGPRAGLEVER